MTQENGFKETEIGLIPSGWEVSLLSNDTVADLIMGQSPASATYNQTGDGVPFMQGKAEFGRVFPNPDKWCTAPSRLAEKNDILMSVRAPVGDVNIAPFKCAIGRGLAAIRAKDKTMPLYLFFYLIFAKKRLEDEGTGSIFKAINKGVLENFKIALPEIDEQKNIIAILSKLQQAIAQQEQIIAKTKELKRSLMHRLFTYGLRGEELKETEIGLMPESWTVVEVGELGEIITGTTPPTKNKEYYMGGGYQFISPFDLGNTKYAYKTEKEISSKGLSVSRCLPKDAVLVVCIGSTIGKVGMTSKDKSATNQQINTIVCDKKYNPHFVYYCLLFKSKYIRSLATPSPVPIMSKGKFQKAVISIPANRDEQDKIAEILSAIDEKVEKAQSRKHVLQDLFRSMLQLLMTGQVRVKDIDFGGIVT